jgi:aminopeptidase
MLTRGQLNKYADVLLWGLQTARKDGCKRGDVVVIRFNLIAICLAEILHAKFLEMGMHPIMRLLATPTMERNFYSLSTNEQLTFIAPGDEELAKNVNGSVHIYAPESLTHLRAIDPRKIASAAVTQKKLREILENRESRGQYSWTLCIYPTQELAKHAKLPLEAYTRQIVKACYLDKKSPVAEWQRIFRNAQTIKSWLNKMKVKHYHIESENVDLLISPGDRRKWVGISGRNIPSFEIFISPDWRKTQGIFYADQPSFRSGNYVKGVKMEFKNGRAVNVKARQGEVFLKKQLAMDGGANKLGEFSLTDNRFSKINQFMANTLFDENFGGRYGNCHVALGSSYSNTFDGDPAKLTQTLKKKLGFNDSALHWDFVNTERKRVSAHLASGRKITIYENGRFNTGLR